MEIVRGLGRVGAAAAIAVAIALLAKGLYPTELPSSPNPDFVDNIFHNRGVLWAARLLLVSAAGVLAFGGIFIVLSIGMRMKSGEWLRRAGPFEISEGRVEQAGSESDFWRQVALAQIEEADIFRDRLAELEELIESARNVR